MKIKIAHLLYFLIPPCLSALLLTLSFPTYDQGWLAWFGLVPLLADNSGRGKAYGFFSFFIFGFLLFTGVCSWLYEVATFKIVHHAIIMTYLGVYFGLFGLIFCMIYKKRGATAALFLSPFVWVSIEYIRSNMSFLALPWSILAHTQYQQPLLMQISSLTGAYGLSFFVFLVNSVLTAVVLRFPDRAGIGKQRTECARPSTTGIYAILLVTLALAGLILFHGHIALSKPLTGEKLKLSILQGNIEQDKKWNPKYSNYIMRTYADLSKTASKDRPELIVWPEAATPNYVLGNQRLLNRLRSIIEETKTSFLIGSAEFSKFAAEKSPRDIKIGNTALLFAPEGRVLGKYLKIFLVPFGEYIPHADKIPWPDFIAVQGNRGWDLPGEEFTIFELNGYKFGTVICWESIFPGLFRKFVKDGATFMINITNEGWFRHKIPHQYVAMNVFRAVENKVFLVRAANTGVSCFIDPYGRITGKVEKHGNDTYVRGYLTQEITISKEKTFYTLYGDIFVYLCLIVSVLILFLSFFSSKKSAIDTDKEAH